MTTGTAAAQELGRFRYAWVRDEGAERCPDGPTIAREVARRLGRDPFVTVSGAPSIEAMVRRDGASWVARIVVRDADGALVGTREFTSASPECTAIASAVTLGVALSIDPEAALRPPPPTPAPTTVPVEVVPARAAAAAPPAWWRRAGASVGVAVAPTDLLLPGTAVGVSLGAEGAPLPWLRLGGGARFFPERATADGGFAFGLTTAWVRACGEPWRGARAAMGFCLAAEVGALQAVVRQGLPSQAGQQAWGAATVSARLRVHLAGPVAAELDLGGLVPFVRHRFHLGATGGGPGNTVFQESPVALVGIAGLALQFR